MSSDRLYYTPPEGSPPFKFVYNGQTIVIQPPDQFWKEVEAGRKTVGKLKSGREISQPQYEWQPDEKMNATGKKPRNYIDASKSMIAWARREENQKHLPDLPMGEWLKTSGQLDQEMGSDYHDRKRQFDEKIKAEQQEAERLLRELADKKEQIRAQLAEADKELQPKPQAAAKR